MVLGAPLALRVTWANALHATPGVCFGVNKALFQLMSRRSVVRHQLRIPVLGHKLELIHGKHTIRKHNPPKVPKHPLQDVDENMNEIITYADLKLRWQFTTKFSSNKLKIARKWRPQRVDHPAPKATCAFVWHDQMPHRFPLPEAPKGKPDLNVQDAFAVFKSSAHHQHKVTVGDLVQAEKLHRREAGEKVVFGTVLLVGTKEFTVIGKPTVPYAKVHATIEQQTLAGEMLVFKYRARKKQSKFWRRRQYVTMLRIDKIEIDLKEGLKADPPPPKPVRLLDLWANRWLDEEEKRGYEMEDDGETPVVARLYDGSEHQPGSYHRRGILSCYRFYPDPQHTHWRI